MADNQNFTYQDGTYHSGPSSTQYNAGTVKSKEPKIGLWIVLGVVAVIIICIFGGTFVVTHENEYTVIKQFGRIDHVVSEAGLSFKVPFIQTAEKLPKQVILYDLPATDVITKDKKSMVADSYTLWRITEPVVFVQKANSSLAVGEKAINAAVYNSIKTVISSMEQTEVITGRDGKLTEMITANIGNQLDEFGIELINVVIKRLDLPDDNKNAVYERMISERNNVAAGEKADGEKRAQIIRTETDHDIAIRVAEAEAKAAQLIAEGEAEYMKTLSQAYNDPDKADFYTFVLSLDAAKASFVNGNKTLILSKDSPLSEIFLNGDVK